MLEVLSEAQPVDPKSNWIHSAKQVRRLETFEEYIFSGQIIATSHDLTPNGGLVREIPLFQGNLGW